MSDQRAATRTRPGQIPSVVAALAIIIALGGAAYGTWRLILKQTGETGIEAVTVQGVNPATVVRGAGGRIARQVVRQPISKDVPVGINKTIGGLIRARRGDAYLRANVNKTGGYNLLIEYVLTVRQGWATPEQYQVSELAAQVLRAPKLAEFIGLTAQQKKQLQDLPAQYVTLTPADRQRLTPLVTAWDKATGPAKEAAAEQLLAAVAAIGAANLQATKDATVKRVQQIPKILTAQQIEKARQWRAPVPTTAPAKAAARTPAKAAAKVPATAPAGKP